jgi:hypothetical protein
MLLKITERGKETSYYYYYYYHYLKKDLISNIAYIVNRIECNIIYNTNKMKKNPPKEYHTVKNSSTS